MTGAVSDGWPPAEGWHWLRRNSSGALRMAFWSRRTSWRVADAIGRTVIRSELKVSQLFTYEQAVLEPPVRRSPEGAGG